MAFSILGGRRAPNRRAAPVPLRMSVSAKRLSKSGARGRELDGFVSEQLQLIDAKLLRHVRVWGRNTISHDLPIVIPIPGMEKADAQRIVYTAIVRSLEERGFETRLLLEDERSTLFAAWMTDLETSEVEAMNSLIRARRLAPAEVEEFVRVGAADAPRAASAARAGRAPPPRPLTVTDAGRVMRPRGGMTAPPAPAGAAAPGRPSRAEAELLGLGDHV